MNIDVHFRSESQTVELVVDFLQLSGAKEIQELISILEIFAADFNMDPELEEEDIRKIMALHKINTNVHFLINEQGVEVKANS